MATLGWQMNMDVAGSGVVEEAPSDGIIGITDITDITTIIGLIGLIFKGLFNG